MLYFFLFSAIAVICFCLSADGKKRNLLELIAACLCFPLSALFTFVKKYRWLEMKFNDFYAFKSTTSGSSGGGSGSGCGFFAIVVVLTVLYEIIKAFGS